MSDVELDDRTLAAITLDQLSHAHWASDQFREQMARVQKYVKRLESEQEALQNEVASWIGAGEDPSIGGLEEEYPAIASALAAWRVRMDNIR